MSLRVSLLQYLSQHRFPVNPSIMSESESGLDFESSPDTSPTLDYDGTDAPVGLSNLRYVAQKRKMLDAVNRLRETG